MVLTVNFVGLMSAIHLQAEIIFLNLIGFWWSSTKNPGGERKEQEPLPLLYMIFLSVCVYTNEPSPAPTDEKHWWHLHTIPVDGVLNPNGRFWGQPRSNKMENQILQCKLFQIGNPEYSLVGTFFFY